MLTEIRAHLRAAAKHPQFRGLPVIVDECDPCVPAHFSRYDNANFGFRNTSYYPTIMASVFKRLMDLNASMPDAPDVTLATSWAFYFEGERFFEGFREFFTAENVELPLLNGYRLLGKLGTTRLALESDSTWPIERLDDLPAPDTGAGRLADREVDGLAASDEGRITLVLWHHTDDQYAAAEPVTVTVELRGLPFDPTRARVRHWRIDDTHSNAYTAWREMGRPQDPTPEQIAALKARQGLEESEPLHLTPAGDGAHVSVHLPLHALCLLEVNESSS
jgi:xylan 1,4-beta-xylosidase